LNKLIDILNPKLLFKFVVCFVLAISNLNSVTIAQTNSSFLVPFNNQGKWTWSDTLGNSIKSRSFDSTGFFFEKRINGKNEILAHVKYNGRNNYYSYKKKLILPKAHSSVDELIVKNPTIETLYFLKNKKGKIGIYSSATNSFVTESIYDSIAFKSTQQDLIYLKKTGSKNLYAFNSQNKKTNRSEYVAIELITESQGEDDFINFRQHEIATKANGTKVERINDLEYPIDQETIDGWKNHPKRTTGFVFDEFDVDFDSKNYAGQPSKNGIILSLDCRQNDYNYKQIKIVHNDGKFGCLNQNDSVILPTIYDRLVIKEQFKYIETTIGAKHGIKLLFTHYPTIEALYDEINLFTHLVVNDKWSFIVYYTRKGNQTGFVGENGVEYYR